MTNKIKTFKIDECVFMNAGEDALYVATDNGVHKYVPEATCHALKHKAACEDIWECSNCKEVLWNGSYEVEYLNHMPRYCKWCGAKIDWTEPMMIR